MEHKYRDVNLALAKVQEYNNILVHLNPARAILEGIFLESDTNQLAEVLNELYDRY